MRKTVPALGAVALIAIGITIWARLEADGPSGTDEAAAQSSAPKDARAGRAAIDFRSVGVPRQFLKQVGPKAFQVVRTDPLRPPGDALAYVESKLAASKSGDAAATYDVYLATLDCRNASSPQELRNFDAMRSARPDAAALKDMERRLGECQALLSNGKLMGGEWLRIAAEQGSVEAMLMYATDTDSVIGGQEQFIRSPEKVLEWKQNSQRYLDEALARGSVDALMMLARASENGIILNADPVRAYAYYKAAERVSQEYAPPSLMNHYQSTLSAEQQQAARQQAEVIYRTCCN